MKIENVCIEDVFPDEGNPRNDFGEIEELAQSFALNKINPGEPFNPIVVVSDGGIYRIVDGERRYRAMLQVGTKYCHAVVCEDYTDADTALAMLATDDKKPLTEVEKSSGYQRALLLGVDPAKADKAAKRKPGTSAKVRRAMDRMGCEAEQMTIDHLLAIEEFADDPEKMDEIANATEATYRKVLETARAEKKNREAMEAIKARCIELGYGWSEQAVDGMSRDRTCFRPEDVPPAVHGAVAVPNAWGRASVTIYVEKHEEIDPEAQRKRERADLAQHLIELMDEDLGEVEAACLGNGERNPQHTVCTACEHAFRIGDFKDTGSAYMGSFAEWAGKRDLEGRDFVDGLSIGILPAWFVSLGAPKPPAAWMFGPAMDEGYEDRFRNSLDGWQLLRTAIYKDGFASDAWEEFDGLCAEVLGEIE